MTLLDPPAVAASRCDLRRSPPRRDSAPPGPGYARYVGSTHSHQPDCELLRILRCTSSRSSPWGGVDDLRDAADTCTPPVGPHATSLRVVLSESLPLSRSSRKHRSRRSIGRLSRLQLAKLTFGVIPSSTHSPRVEDEADRSPKRTPRSGISSITCGPPQGWRGPSRPEGNRRCPPPVAFGNPNSSSHAASYHPRTRPDLPVVDDANLVIFVAESSTIPRCASRQKNQKKTDIALVQGTEPVNNSAHPSALLDIAVVCAPT